MSQMSCNTESNLVKICVFNGMPLCSTHQLRRTGLTLGAALLITVLGAPLSLHAQQLDTSNSSTSSSNDWARCRAASLGL